MGLAWQFFIFSIIAFACNFDYGFSSSYLNTPVNQFHDYLNESLRRAGKEMTESTYNWIWNLICNIWFVGFFIGIWLSPLLNDRFGRKVGFIIGNGGNLLGAILRFLGIIFWQPTILFAGRVLTSIFTAISFQSSILYLQESSPTNVRGILSTLSEVAFAVMCVVTSLLGTPEFLGDHLSYLLGIALPPCLFFFVFIFFIPETPKYLLLVKGDRKGAAKAVKYFHGDDANIDYVLDEIALEAEDEKETDSALVIIKEIFSESYLRKALMLSICALQLTVADWSLLLLSTYFLQRVSLSNSLAAWSSTGMTIAFMIGTFFGSLFVERLGRRPLLLFFSISNNIIIVVYVICALLEPHFSFLKYGCLAALVGHGFTFGAGIGNVAWFLSAELVPQRYRSQVQAISYGFNTIAVVVVTFTTLPLYQLIDVYSFLVLFSLPSILSIIYLIVYLPETKGREVHQIVDQLRGKKQRQSQRVTDTSSKIYMEMSEK